MKPRIESLNGYHNVVNKDNKIVMRTKNKRIAMHYLKKLEANEDNA